MTDEEKNEWCKRRNGMGAVILPPSLYTTAEKAGVDMRWHIISKPIPERDDL
jgi:hypothetical protein